MFTKEELMVIKRQLAMSLESIYASFGTPNAKELAFIPLEKFNGDHDIDIENTQSALKKVIEEIVNEG